MSKMNKKIENLELGKVVRAAAAMSDEQKLVTDGDQLRKMIVQFSDEIGEITKGCSFEDKAKVLHIAFQQVEQFDKEPHLKDLFR
jgi:hypothetical protein